MFRNIRVCHSTRVVFTRHQVPDLDVRIVRTTRQRTKYLIRHDLCIVDVSTWCLRFIKIFKIDGDFSRKKLIQYWSLYYIHRIFLNCLIASLSLEERNAWINSLPMIVIIISQSSTSPKYRWLFHRSWLLSLSVVVTVHNFELRVFETVCTSYVELRVVLWDDFVDDETGEIFIEILVSIPSGNYVSRIFRRIQIQSYEVLLRTRTTQMSSTSSLFF